MMYSSNRSTTMTPMHSRLPLTDFRALRVVLGGHDPAADDQDPDPSPHDRIGEETWHRLLAQPSDVSITVSEYHGSMLAVQDHLRQVWWEAHLPIVEAPNDPVLYAMQDVAGEFHAAIFDSLHGFYRQSIGSLRSCVEFMLEGCAKALIPEQNVKGSGGFSFRREADLIRRSARMRTLDDQLSATCGKRLFAVEPEAAGAGWVGDLYGRLSEYTHARPGRTLLDTWESAGPVYVYSMVRECHSFFVEVFCAACILAAVGRPSVILPNRAAKLIKQSRVEPTDLALAALRTLYPGVFQ